MRARAAVLAGVILVIGILPASAEKPLKDYSFIKGVNYHMENDPAILDRDLGYGKRVGLNSTRIWLSYRNYEKDPHGYITRLRNYIRRSHELGFSTMPILFNGNGLNPDMLKPEFRPRGDAYVKAIVEAVKGEPGLLMWDIMNEPLTNKYCGNVWPTDKPQRAKQMSDFLRHYISYVKKLDPVDATTVGYNRANQMAPTADLVDVLSFHEYTPLRSTIEQSYRTAEEISRKFGNKPILNTETGCISRANPYDVVLQISQEHKTGWYLYNLMIQGYWAPVQGIFYADGTVRDPSTIAAIMGFYRNRNLKTIVKPLPDREGHCQDAMRSINSALRGTGGVFHYKNTPTGKMLDAAEEAANLLESAEMVSMDVPPSAKILYWRHQPENQRDRDAIRAFTYHRAEAQESLHAVLAGLGENMQKGILATLSIAALLPGVLFAARPAYLDPSQPVAKRVNDLIPRLTLAEKASLMSTTAPAIPRLKIPAMNGWNQSLHGIVWTQPTTMFPAPIAMAATWDSGLVEQIASAIADEGRAIYNVWHTVHGRTVPGTMGQPITITADGKRYAHNGLIYRSPVINMVRDPHWGRVWETFGEDPVLTERMTVAYVKGTQGNNPRCLELGATVKHYAVYDQEIDRHLLNAQVSRAMIRDYYLPQFKAGIMAGKSVSIMSSYNQLNGVPNAINKWLLTDVLRDEWGFQGFLVPDSGAVNMLVLGTHTYKTLTKAAAESVLAGSDLDNGAFAKVLPEAVKDGYLNEADLDKALRRVLAVRFRLGVFDPPSMVPFSKIPASDIDSPAHRKLALRAAQESIVLLTNKNHFLPLDPSKLKTIAVIGPFADYAQTGPNYTGLYSKFVKPLDGIKNAVGTGVRVLYARGSGILETDHPKQSMAEAVAAAKKADVAILFVGTNQTTEREGIDRNTLSLPAAQLRLVRAVTAANPKSAIVLLNGGPITLPLARPGTTLRPRRRRGIDVPAVLDMFWNGEEGGTAIADVLFGKYNPAGRLPYTVYASELQLPARSEYDITKGFTYMYVRGKPEYAFGHGLSYTTFTYSNLSLSSSRIPATGTVTVKLEIQNTGQRAGDEVPQLYVSRPAVGEWHPKEQLESFDRIHLKPGEKKAVTFRLPIEQLAAWDQSAHRFEVKPGTYHIMLGAASDDIRQKAEVQVSDAGNWPASELTTKVSDLDISTSGQ